MLAIREELSKERLNILGEIYKFTHQEVYLSKRFFLVLHFGLPSCLREHMRLAWTLSGRHQIPAFRGHNCSEANTAGCPQGVCVDCHSRYPCCLPLEIPDRQTRSIREGNKAGGIRVATYRGLR